MDCAIYPTDATYQTTSQKGTKEEADGNIPFEQGSRWKSYHSGTSPSHRLYLESLRLALVSIRSASLLRVHLMKTKLRPEPSGATTAAAAAGVGDEWPS
jgi:hypothetical protein